MARSSALAEDLQRHLADEPVLARPPSALYWLRKTARSDIASAFRDRYGRRGGASDRNGGERESSVPSAGRRKAS
jgi:hypothetical protein